MIPSSGKGIIHGDHIYWVMSLSMGVLPLLKMVLGKNQHLATSAALPLVLFTWFALRNGFRRRRVDDMSLLAYAMLAMGAMTLIVGLWNGNSPKYIASDLQIGYCLLIITLLAAKGSPDEHRKFFNALAIPAVSYFVLGLPYLLANAGNRRSFMAMADAGDKTPPAFAAFMAGSAAISMALFMIYRQRSKLGRLLCLSCLFLTGLYILFSLTRTLLVALIVPGLIATSVNMLKRGQKLKWVGLLVIMVPLIGALTPSVILERSRERMGDDSALTLNGRFEEIHILFSHLEFTQEGTLGRGLGGLFFVRRNPIRIDKGIKPHIEFFWGYLKGGWPGLLLGLLGFALYLRRVIHGYWRNPMASSAMLSMMMVSFTGGSLSNPFSLLTLLGANLSIANPRQAAKSVAPTRKVTSARRPWRGAAHKAPRAQ